MRMRVIKLMKTQADARHGLPQVQTYAAWKASRAGELTDQEMQTAQNGHQGRGSMQRVSALLPAKRPRRSPQPISHAEPEIRPATPPRGDSSLVASPKRWCNIM